MTKIIAEKLRQLANWIDPPRDEIVVYLKVDASEVLDSLDMIRRRLKSPCINGEIP